MPRFITNRWWTFILALILGLGLLVMQPAGRSYAASPGAGTIGGDEGGQGGGPPAPGNGDPDLPITRTKPVMRGGTIRPMSSSGMLTVGDGRMTDSALMWRLQVVMRVLRTLYLR